MLENIRLLKYYIRAVKVQGLSIFDFVRIFCFGIVSGLPVVLTSSSLFVWLRENGLELKYTLLFALASLPYALKFLWAGLVDKVKIPFLRYLGRRRSWLFLAIIVLVIAFINLSFVDPKFNIYYFFGSALFMAFSSATYDIVFDAYRAELLPVSLQSMGSFFSVFGFKIGLIFGNAGALFLAEIFNWQFAYSFFAIIISLATLVCLWGKEPYIRRVDNNKEYFLTNMRDKFGYFIPIMEFLRRSNSHYIIIFIISLKLGNAMLGCMTNTFLLDLGFNKRDMCMVILKFGMIPTGLGAFVIGIIISRFSLSTSLFTTVGFQFLSNLIFILQNYVGYNFYVLNLAIALENFSGGMTTAFFITYVSYLCNLKYTATQFSLLSSFASLSRIILTSTSGSVADDFGWGVFFACTALITLVPLLVKKHLDFELLQKYPNLYR